LIGRTPSKALVGGSRKRDIFFVESCDQDCSPPRLRDAELLRAKDSVRDSVPIPLEHTTKSLPDRHHRGHLFQNDRPEGPICPKREQCPSHRLEDESSPFIGKFGGSAFGAPGILQLCDASNDVVERSPA